MKRRHQQVEWDSALEHDLRQLIQLTVAEDLQRQQDWTTVGLVPHTARATAHVVARQPGVIAGLLVGKVVLDSMHADADWTPLVSDGQPVSSGQRVARLSGSVRDLLVAERTILNFLGQLSGVGTMTAAFVARIAGTGAEICDTRKTLPGWRRLQKYAVRCGGGTNHRLGLYDAVLIKDNHIAFGNESAAQPFDVADAVRMAREFVRASAPDPQMIIEIEVDRLEQLQRALSAAPDMVLLDNMTPSQLSAAVAMRDAGFPDVLLEASGGVTLDTVAAIARSGVDRVSVGALTHSSQNFDVGLDWVS